MSHRIAVFDNGRIAQIGTPREIYERPSSAFVASFVGSTNLFSGEAARRIAGREGVFTLRPENVRLSRGGDGLEARITSMQYLGAETRFHCALDDGMSISATEVSSEIHDLRVGTMVRLSWDPDAVFAVSVNDSA